MSLWRNVQGKSFEQVKLPLDGMISASSAVPIDFDNDGWIDLAVLVQTTGGTQLRMLRNMGPAGFVDVSLAAAPRSDKGCRQRFAAGRGF